jgi:hypothetical protein
LNRWLSISAKLTAAILVRTVFHIEGRVSDSCYMHTDAKGLYWVHNFTCIHIVSGTFLPVISDAHTRERVPHTTLARFSASGRGAMLPPLILEVLSLLITNIFLVLIDGFSGWPHLVEFRDQSTTSRQWV